VATRFLVLAALFVLAACGAVPRPFHAPADAPPNALAAPDASVDIRVEAVEGTSQPLARLLARSVAEELAALQLTAVAREKGSSRYTMSGQARTPEGDGPETHAVVIESSPFTPRVSRRHANNGTSATRASFGGRAGTRPRPSSASWRER
jgi:hypothetical protein